jgi:hypothetical protein
MRITRQILALAAVGFIGFAAPSRVQAQFIDFNGAVAGCFTLGTTCSPSILSPYTVYDDGGGSFGTCPAGPIGSCDGLHKLEYTGQLITGTTSGNGFNNGISFGSALSAGSFGSMTEKGLYDNTVGLNLVLYFFFNTAATTIGPPISAVIGAPAPTTVPPGSTPGISSVVLTGHVTALPTGTVHISWFGATHPCVDPLAAGSGCVDFEFEGGGHVAGGCDPGVPASKALCVNSGFVSGTAEISVNNFDLGKNSTNKISGHIYVLTASPEPATLALFATGLVGLVPVVRYRRRKVAM